MRATWRRIPREQQIALIATGLCAPLAVILSILAMVGILNSFGPALGVGIAGFLGALIGFLTYGRRRGGSDA